MKGRERMWVEDIRCKGMGVVMKGRERMWVEDIRCKGMGVMKGRERMWVYVVKEWVLLWKGERECE